MNVHSGQIKQELLNEFNEKNRGRYYINVSETDSHFMTAESTCVMCEQLYAYAFRLQRAKYNMDATTRGALQADDFTGNSATLKGHDIRRENQVGFTQKARALYENAFLEQPAWLKEIHIRPASLGPPRAALTLAAAQGLQARNGGHSC